MGESTTGEDLNVNHRNNTGPSNENFPRDGQDPEIQIDPLASSTKHKEVDDNDRAKDEKTDNKDVIVTLDTRNTFDSRKTEGDEGNYKATVTADDSSDYEKSPYMLWPTLNMKVSPEVAKLPKKRSGLKYFLEFFLFLLLLALPIIIVGVLSGFRRGSHSSHAQRVWIMGWIASGQLLGLQSIMFSNGVRSYKFLRNNIRDIKMFLQGDESGQKGFQHLFVVFIVLLIILPFMAFPVGGYIVVGKMILSYGDCQRIG